MVSTKPSHTARRRIVERHRAIPDIAVCNFVERYHATLRSLREAVPRLSQDGLNDARVFDFVCCANESSLSAILSDEGYFDRPPLLSERSDGIVLVAEPVTNSGGMHPENSNITG
jgi:hypothetical protein